MTIQELIDRYGLQEINERTKISNDNILNLLNEDYDSVSKANALGFLKIVEREFEVDLGGQKERIKQALHDENYVPKELLVTERRYGGKKKFAGGAFVVLLLVGGISYTFYLMNFQNSSSSKSTALAMSDDNSVDKEIQATTQTQTMQESQVVQQLEQTSPQVAKIEQADTQEEKQTLPPQDQVEQEVPKETEQNIDEVIIEEQIDLQASDETPQNGSTQEGENALEDAKVLDRIAMQEVVIQPLRRLWLGHINLDSNERVQRNTAGEIIIDADNTIIITGHGRFDIGDNEFRTGDRQYFHFVDGELQVLNESAFRELNEGRLW
ncbi:MAG: hypothetical protein ACQESH_01575 [Campylobacterota bacterium]